MRSIAAPQRVIRLYEFRQEVPHEGAVCSFGIECWMGFFDVFFHESRGDVLPAMGAEFTARYTVLRYLLAMSPMAHAVAFVRRRGATAHKDAPFLKS